MSNELERWANPSIRLVPSRSQRQHKKAVERVVQETQLGGLKIDAEAALTGLDSYRRQLANGDPVLDAVLTRIEIGFVDKACRIQRNFGIEFPL